MPLELGLKEKGKLPLKTRREMFRRTLELYYAHGLGLRKIQKQLRIEFGTTVSRSTLSYWLRELHAPYCQKPELKPKLKETAQKIELQPCPELAYVIGAVLGDGTTIRSKKRIVLRAKDNEFVEEVARCLASVLGRPVKVGFDKSRGFFAVRVRSAALYELLRKSVDLERLKPYVEHCEE